MQKYNTLQNKKITPQSKKIPGSPQIRNNAGGYVWQVSDQTLLDRFLMLGTIGGTYYVGQDKLTDQATETLRKMIKSNGAYVVDRTVEISLAGRAPKNDHALFVLALASVEGDENTRIRAYEALSKVARIGTHLFHFLAYREALGGWSAGLRRAVGKWYNRDVEKVAYDVVKYRQRDGWSHRDVLRLSHPSPKTAEHSKVFDWVTKGNAETDLPEIVLAYEALKRAETVEDVISILEETPSLPREAIPSQFLNSKEVWEALLRNGMPIMAMIRNLGVMTKNGVLGPLSINNSMVLERLADEEAIKRARIHPVQILIALKTYESGLSKGGRAWTAVQPIVDALNEAFYLSFKTVQPTGKNFLLGLDVSGSMSAGNVGGVVGLTPATVSAAMSLTTAKVEKNYHILGFANGLRDLGVSPSQRLDTVIKKVSNLTYGGTDCSLPMQYALKNQLDVDTFVVYTDNETWAGKIHPSQALEKYRAGMGKPNAQLIVVGMTATNFSIANPADKGMLDICGFDSATPSLISDFARGW